LAPVRGTVTVDGTPVTSGKVYFAPIAQSENRNVGKQGVGRIQSDGTFVVGTYELGDGAQIGPHRISIVDVEHKTPHGDLSFDRLFVPDRQFEVVGGQENVFDIELTGEVIREYAQRAIEDD
jgi:hypothetical protein